jgi:hypothetical protein
MSTKAATARVNGAKSNGPVTEEGKARSSQNSLKHGLNSSRVVLEHESQEEYDELEASIANRFKPADTIEGELVKEMAESRWRLRRVAEMESALIARAIRRQMEELGPDADPAEARALAYADVAESKSFRSLGRHQAQLRRAYEKAWKELERIQDDRIREEQGDENSKCENEPNLRFTKRLLDVLLTPPPHPARVSHASSGQQCP